MASSSPSKPVLQLEYHRIDSGPDHSTPPTSTDGEEMYIELVEHLYDQDRWQYTLGGLMEAEKQGRGDETVGLREIGGVITELYGTGMHPRDLVGDLHCETEPNEKTKSISKYMIEHTTALVWEYFMNVCEGLKAKAYVEKLDKIIEGSDLMRELHNI
ncbi:hypothetical protein NHQ30_009370 [Ciborinia camelliae]|nr:hypothetical protein NHQ30_009370 [Ciborinia camelliae]